MVSALAVPQTGQVIVDRAIIGTSRDGVTEGEQYRPKEQPSGGLAADGGPRMDRPWRASRFRHPSPPALLAAGR